MTDVGRPTGPRTSSFTSPEDARDTSSGTTAQAALRGAAATSTSEIAWPEDTYEAEPRAPFSRTTLLSPQAQNPADAVSRLRRLEPRIAELARCHRIEAACDVAFVRGFHSMRTVRDRLKMMAYGMNDDGVREHREDAIADLRRLMRVGRAWEAYQKPSGEVVLTEALGDWPSGLSRPNPGPAEAIVRPLVHTDIDVDVPAIVKGLAATLPWDFVRLVKEARIPLHFGTPPPWTPTPRDPVDDIAGWVESRQARSAGQFYRTRMQAWAYRGDYSVAELVGVARHELIHGVIQALGSNGRPLSSDPRWTTLHHAPPRERINPNAITNADEHLVEAMDVYLGPVNDWPNRSGAWATRVDLERVSRPIRDFVHEVWVDRIPAALLPGARLQGAMSFAQMMQDNWEQAKITVDASSQRLEMFRGDLDGGALNVAHCGVLVAMARPDAALAERCAREIEEILERSSGNRRKEESFARATAALPIARAAVAWLRDGILPSVPFSRMLGQLYAVEMEQADRDRARTVRVL